MDNLCVDVVHSKSHYKGKSIDFAGTWEPNVRYFNDDYLTNFVVYVEKDFVGNVINSALLSCKKTHVSKVNTESDSTNNQPVLKLDDKLGTVGIEPNDYWIYVCGSIHDSTKYVYVVNTYSDALKITTDANLGKIVYVKNPKGSYIVAGTGRLQKIYTGNEVDKILETKVEKIDGKGLSTEDFTTEEKEKLATVANNAQANIIEKIQLNGINVAINNKTANIVIPSNDYTLTQVVPSSVDYVASYALKKNGIPIGATINIPATRATYGGSIKIVETTNIPYTGANVGDAYIDFVVTTSTSSHFYIPIPELANVYTGSEYIDVSSNNVISLKYDNLKTSLKANIFNEAVGDGLQYQNDKLSVKIKPDSSLHINNDGELELIWL